MQNTKETEKPKPRTVSPREGAYHGSLFSVNFNSFKTIYRTFILQTAIIKMSAVHDSSVESENPTRAKVTSLCQHRCHFERMYMNKKSR